jgi:flagellin
MRELAVQAANGSNSGSDTALLNQEFNQLQIEVGRIQSSTNFNNVNVFQANDIVFQVGANTTSGDRVNMQGTPLVSTQAIGTTSITDSPTINPVASIFNAISNASTSSIDNVKNSATDAINTNQQLSYSQKTTLLNNLNTAYTAASLNNQSGPQFQTALNAGLGTLTSSTLPTTASASALLNPNLYALNLGSPKAAATLNTALAAASFTTAVSVSAAATYLKTQLNGITSLPASVISDLTNTINTQAASAVSVAALGTALGVSTTAATTDNLVINTIPSTVTASLITSLGTTPQALGGQTNALNAINSIDAALSEVNIASATQGALQNRFSAVISNLTAFSQSQTAAKSRIVDADFAAETAKLSKNQILSQAGTAMLAQANQLPSGILSLLKNG